MTFKKRGEGERALCDKFDFYVCQNNHVWSYLCPGGSQPIIPWASDPRFGRTSDYSEIVAPLTLHLRRVDKGETYIQCLVLEAGLYQNYEREERKGRRKRNKMMKWKIKRKRRREGGGEAQSVMLLCTWKAPALHCVQIHFHKLSLSNIFGQFEYTLFRSCLDIMVDLAAQVAGRNWPLAAPTYPKEVAWVLKCLGSP